MLIEEKHRVAALALTCGPEDLNWIPQIVWDKLHAEGHVSTVEGHRTITASGLNWMKRVLT